MRDIIKNRTCCCSNETRHIPRLFVEKKLLVSVVFGSNSDSLMVVVKVEEGLIQEKKTFVSKLVCRTRKPIKAASHQPAKPKNRHTEKLPYAHFHQKLRARVLFEETSKL